MSDYRHDTGVALQAALDYTRTTHAELAAKVGVAANTVSRWTRGESEMKAAYIGPVADALGVPTDLFVRPPASREEALTMIGAWRTARRASPARDA